MTEEEVAELIKNMYAKEERLKLVRYTHKQKMKYNVTNTLRFFCHICLNIGPQVGINQDIAGDLKDAQVPKEEPAATEEAKATDQAAEKVPQQESSPE